jgi:hypothetical protein
MSVGASGCATLVSSDDRMVAVALNIKNQETEDRATARRQIGESLTKALTVALRERGWLSRQGQERGKSSSDGAEDAQRQVACEPGVAAVAVREQVNAHEPVTEPDGDLIRGPSRSSLVVDLCLDVEARAMGRGR